MSSTYGPSPSQLCEPSPVQWRCSVPDSSVGSGCDQRTFRPAAWWSGLPFFHDADHRLRRSSDRTLVFLPLLRRLASDG